MTPAQVHITDTLDRAQKCWELVVGHSEPVGRHDAVSLLICHVTTAVLFEHIRRLDPALAERLTPWLLSEDSIFSDGYAGELLYQWRQQIAAGQPMHPIGPDEERTA